MDPTGLLKLIALETVGLYYTIIYEEGKSKSFRDVTVRPLCTANLRTR